MMAFAATLFLIYILIPSVFSPGQALSLNYYNKTCPIAESIVADTVKKATMKDRTVPATLLRMHFHDCFLRGCDGSILLSSKGKNKAEKDAAPNGSLHAFYVIDSAKQQIESVCPGVVSCADILAFAARDAVVLSGGPTWDVPKGRKDGRISRASETTTLPSPLFNISQLQQNFALRGLSLNDLAALLGAHTLGFAHCSSFESRINKNNLDPMINPTFAQRLRNLCPVKNRAPNAGSPMDPSSKTFDNTYYKLLIQKKSLFHSDEALLTHPTTKNLVYKYATSRRRFREAFVKSITKLSSITGGQEVRKNCRVIN